MTTRWVLVAIFWSVILALTVGMKKEESLEEEDMVDGAGEGLRVGEGGTGVVMRAGELEDEYMHAEFAGDEYMR